MPTEPRQSNGARRRAAPIAHLLAISELARERSRELRARGDIVLRESDAVMTAAAQRFGDGARFRSTVESLQMEIAGLRAAMASRAVIEQAKGIIMASEGFARLDSHRNCDRSQGEVVDTDY